MPAGYKVGEKVLALDSGVLYPAKILRVMSAGATLKYFITYIGWARKYNCWVDDSVMASPDDTVKKEKILESCGIFKKPESKNRDVKADGDTTEVSEGGPSSDAISLPSLSSSSSAQPSTTTTDKRQRGAASNGEDEAEALRKHRRKLSLMDMLDEDDETFVAKLPIPMPLKKQLVDEWTLVTQLQPQRLLKLPRPTDVTVVAVVRAFMVFKMAKLESEQPEQIAHYKDLFEGLIGCFDMALPTILLYRQERRQFEALDAQYERVAPSRIYGLEHLLRLFVRMPQLLRNVFLPPADLNQILQRLAEFLKYIGKNAGSYLSIVDYATVEEAMAHLEAAPLELGLVQPLPEIKHIRKSSGSGSSNNNSNSSNKSTAGTKNGRKIENKRLLAQAVAASIAASCPSTTTTKGKKPNLEKEPNKRGRPPKSPQQASKPVNEADAASLEADDTPCAEGNGSEVPMSL